MRLSEAFPKEHLSADDLNGESLSVVIASWKMKPFKDKEGNETLKPVIYFQHHQKGLALNWTNAKKVSEICGSDDLDDWIGREIILFPAMVDAFGETKEAIRVRAPQSKDRHRSPGRQDPISTAPQRGTYAQSAQRGPQSIDDYGPEPPPRERDDR